MRDRSDEVVLHAIELAQSLVLFGELAEERFALGDVACDRGNPSHDAVYVAYRRHRQRDRKDRPVLSHARSLARLDRLAAPKGVEVQVDLDVALRLDDRVNPLPDHLVGAVAVQPLRRPVPAHNPPVEGRRRDRIVGGLDDRGNLSELLVLSAHLGAQPLALPHPGGDAAQHEEREHADHPDQRERLKLVTGDALAQREAR